MDSCVIILTSVSVRSHFTTYLFQKCSKSQILFASPKSSLISLTLSKLSQWFLNLYIYSFLSCLHRSSTASLCKYVIYSGLKWLEILTIFIIMTGAASSLSLWWYNCVQRVLPHTSRTFDLQRSDLVQHEMQIRVQYKKQPSLPFTL